MILGNNIILAPDLLLIQQTVIVSSAELKKITSMCQITFHTIKFLENFWSFYVREQYLFKHFLK